MKESPEDRIFEAKVKLMALILLVIAMCMIAVVIYFQLINPPDPMVIQWQANQCLTQIVGNCIVK